VKGPNTTIFFAGWYDQTSTLISGSSTRTLTNAGDRDIVIGQINTASHEIGFAKTFSDPAFEEATAIAWTGSNIIAAGQFSGTTSIGSTSLVSSDFDVWVAKLSSTDGSPMWAVRLGSAGPDKNPVLAVDSNGDIYVAGTIGGTAMFGSYAVGNAGGLDIFIAKLRNSDGSVVWATSVGSPGDEGIGGIAISQSNQLVVSMGIAGPLVAGGPWAGDQDAAFVSYDGSGTRLWTKVFGTPGSDGGSGVTSGIGAFYLTANLGADIGSTIEGVPILGAPKPSGILLKVQP
jgi:hypothetical protein